MKMCLNLINNQYKEPLRIPSNNLAANKVLLPSPYKGIRETQDSLDGGRTVEHRNFTVWHVESRNPA